MFQKKIRKGNYFVLFWKPKDLFQQALTAPSSLPTTSSSLPTIPTSLPTTSSSLLKTPDPLALKLTTPNKNKAPDPVSRTPNIRQRKSRLSRALTSNVQEEFILTNKEDQTDVISLSLKHLNLYDVFYLQRKPNKTGHKLTLIINHTAVWGFWYSNCTFLTITSRPAKLRISDKTHTQSGLDFIDTVNIISKRNKYFYESNWMITIKHINNFMFNT